MSQPAPIKNDYPAAWDMAIKAVQNVENIDKKLLDFLVAEMRKRDDLGLKRYGVRLQPFNGRDAQTDCFEEILDAFVYSIQSDYEDYVECMAEGKDAPEGKLSNLIGGVLLEMTKILMTGSKWIATSPPK